MNKEIEDLKLNTKEQFENMFHKIDKIYEAIYGNGKIGILTKVENQGLMLKIIGWCVGVIYTAGITWIICAVMDLIKK
jgi:hypothetical protein